MTHKFPLYSSIANLIAENPQELSDAKKKDLSIKIRSFDRNTQELIYALIKAYDINNDGSSVTTLPFGGKTLKSGLKFDINVLPLRLQRILLKFSEMHSANIS